MKKQTNYTANSEMLRQKAEELLKKNKTKKTSKLTELETLKLIHELEVHQIELEMQYDELEKAKARAEELASEKYADLYDHAPSGYFTLSKAGEILELNLCGSQMLGKARQLLKSSLFGFFVSDDTRSTFNLFLEHLFESKAKETCDVTLSVNNSSLMYVHLSGILIEKDNECLITAVDITKRILAEVALRLSEERLRTITENAPNIIMEVDKYGRILYTNHILPENNLEDVIGKKFWEWTPREYYVDSINALEFVFSNALPKSFQSSSLGANGEIYRYQSNLSPVKVSGQVENAILIISDITERIKTQERYSAILHTAMEGFWLVDLEGYLLEVNKTYCTMSGFSMQELLTMRISDLDVLDTENDIKARMQKIISQGEDSFESKHRRKDGSIFDIEVNIQYVPVDFGQFVVFLHDITKRKLVEENLRQSEERYKSLFQGNHSVMLLIDPESGEIKDANPAACTFYGWPHSELTNKNISEINTLSKDGIAVDLHNSKTKKDNHLFFQHRLANGKLRDVEVYSGPITFGESTLLYSIIHDITESKLSQDALIESELKFRKYIDHAPHGVFVANEKGQYIDVNLAASIITGYSKEELFSINLLDLTHEDLQENAIQHFNQVTTVGFATGEFAFVRKDGSKRYWTVDAVKLSDKVFLGFVVDITSRKKTEEALVKNEQLLRESQAAAHIGSYSADLINKTWTASPQMYKIFGINENHPRTLDAWIMSVHPDFREELVDEVFQIKGKKESFDREYKIVRISDNVERWVHGIGEFEYDNQMNPIRLIGTIQDITDHKQAEESLIESEQRYHSLFNESNDAIFLVDLTSGGYIDCNRLAETITGYSREEILSLKTGALLPPHLKQEVASNIELIRTHNLLRKETEIITTDGKIIPVEFNSSKVEINKKQYILSMMHDISDRKAAQEALRESEESLRKAQEIAHVGSWSFDFEKNILTWNDELYRIFEMHPYEFSSTFEGFLDSVHPEDRDAVIAAYNNSILEGKNNYKIEHRIFRKHSLELRHVLEKCEHVRDASGKIIRSIGMTLDITEQKQAELALKELNEELEKRIDERTAELLNLNETLKLAEEKYRTVADFTTNWEFWISPDNQIIYCSPSCERITGYSVSDFVVNPQLLFDIIHPEDLPMYLEHKKQETLAHTCKDEIKFRIFRKNGSICWIGHFCQPVFDKSGHFKGIRGSNKDINSRKKAEELLKKSNLKYSLLSANITDGIFIFRNGCFEYVNKAMSHIFGYQGTELIDLGLKHLILPEYANELEFIQTSPILNQKRCVEIECIKKDGSTIYVEFLFNYIATEKVIYGVAHDITDKKQIQKNIVKAIILTEEKERTYFSKELHDGLGPLLSTIKLYLEWSKEANNRQSREEIVSKAEEIIEDSIRTVKEISNKLSPHILINFGLCSAIKSFVDKLQETSSINVKFDCNLPRRLGSEIEAAIYRAVIECINNTLKYSGAKNITIILNDTGNQLQLRYLDDGIGFDIKETIAIKKGLGLFNLQNRIQTIGGKIKMLSKPGKGVDYRIVVNI